MFGSQPVPCVQCVIACLCLRVSPRWQLGELAPPCGSVTIPVLTGVAAIATGSVATCALTLFGDVVCWGAQSFGQLGSGYAGGTNYPTVPSVSLSVTPTPSVTPSVTPTVLVGNFITAVVTGPNARHTCAVESPGGALRCWGYNLYGQVCVCVCM